MADPAQPQDTGSGEGPPEVKPEAPVEAKPAVEQNTTANSVVKTDVQPAQAEAKNDTTPIADQTAAPNSAPDKKEDQPKAPEAKTNAEASVDKEEPVKETVLVAELNIPNAESQPKDAPPTEVKDAQTVTAEVKEEVKSEPVSVDAKKDEAQPKEGDWQHREQELLKKIEELETLKKERTEDGIKLELKVREEEIDLLKARVKNLETELQAALSKPGAKNHEMVEKIKQQHEELLSKARGMIFDKTKMVKNQELQIEALTTQVQSLKDINLITKDLLDIRNSEVKAMEERLQVMEARFRAEKERYDLVLKRAQTSNTVNDDLRREYETQLKLFKELREKYELRVQALVAENNRLKQGGGTSG